VGHTDRYAKEVINMAINNSGDSAGALSDAPSGVTVERLSECGVVSAIDHPADVPVCVSAERVPGGLSPEEAPGERPPVEDLLPDTHIFYPRLESNCNGWTYTGGIGGAVANWVDNPDDPLYGVGIVSTGAMCPPEGEDEIPTSKGLYGSRPTRFRNAEGYELSIGATGTDGSAPTFLRFFGHPDQTPRQAEPATLASALQYARWWMKATPPERARDRVDRTEQAVEQAKREGRDDGSAVQTGLGGF
jgi:hypothetical protein